MNARATGALGSVAISVRWSGHANQRAAERRICHDLVTRKLESALTWWTASLKLDCAVVVPLTAPGSPRAIARANLTPEGIPMWDVITVRHKRNRRCLRSLTNES